MTTKTDVTATGFSFSPTANADKSIWEFLRPGKGGCDQSLSQDLKSKIENIVN